MNESFTAFFDLLESSFVAVSIRQSIWLYPFIEIIHIFGIVLVAGGAVFFDLQLLFSRQHQFIEKSAYGLLTWSKRGLLVAIPSGALLFITNATALSVDPVFGLKLFTLLLAAVNAWIFHIRVYLPYRENQSYFNWKMAKTNAVFSIILWMSVISFGRLLAY